MAISSSWVLSLKIFLISTGIASIALLMNLSVPFITHFVLHQIPLIWSALITLSKPPYLYFLVNGIIITIAVTSRFHHHRHDGSESSSKPPPPPVSEPSKPPPPSDLGYGAVPDLPEFGGVGSTAADGGEVVEKSVVVSGDGMDVGFMASPERSVFAEVEVDYVAAAAAASGKPLVSSRFGHRKPLKASPEGGRSLRVAKPKRQETLESTWKAITDGRHMPLTRHLSKSGSLENYGSRQSSGGADHSPPPQAYRKSDTFRDRTNYHYPQQPPASAASPKLLRKEASLSKDELNRRVEAFIKKFNDEMRLQRQKSMAQYIQMINRGAH